MRLLLLLAAAAPLFAQSTCTYSFAPVPTQNINITADASSNSIAITAPVGCAWSYSTSATWITLPATSLQGTGNGTIPWQAAANPFSVPRSGVIVVNDIAFGTTTTFTIMQAVPTCVVTLVPATGTAVVGGATGSVQVQTNCVWQAGSNNTWITVTAPGTGTLNGTVGYTAAANVCVNQRTGSLTVFAGSTSVYQNFSLVQDGSDANLTIAPANLPSAPATGADGKVTVTTGAICGWSAYSDVSWITITGVAGGTGPGGFGYHIVANPSVARTGNIHVGSLLFTVTQQPAAATAVQLNAVLNGGSYAQGAVSPGEVVAVFGVNMGPVQGAQPTGGSFPTTLANAQLLFDSVPAPLLYVSASQVNAVVPFAVTGSTQVQAVYQGTPSNTLTIPVQAATPGLLTLDRSGIGPGAILNQDFTTNTAANAAARGSAIMIYCVGGGATNPASTDGAIIATPISPALPPVLTQTVTVTIGGDSAKVLYQGFVPGSIAGLTQINAIIPSGVTPGSNVPVSVQIGNWLAQTGVTVAVK